MTEAEKAVFWFERAQSWAEDYGSAAGERDRYRMALMRIVHTPGVEIAGTGRDHHGKLNGHEKCVEIAIDALRGFER